MARRTRDTVERARDLARLGRRLDEWRGIHSRGVAFPEALWRAAGRVAQRRGVYRTARTLGLEYNKLKAASGAGVARTSRKATVLSTTKPMQFVELTGAFPVSPSGCRLSLQSATGQRLHLEMAPGAATEMVLQLCRSGWSASP